MSQDWRLASELAALRVELQARTDELELEKEWGRGQADLLTDCATAHEEIFATLQAAREALRDSQRECAHHHRSTVEAEKALRFIAGEYVDGCEAWRGLSNEQVARAVLVEGGKDTP